MTSVDYAPRRGWWGYVKWVIRDQPEKRADLSELQRTMRGRAFSTVSQSNDPGRGVEIAALRTLPGWAGVEFEAVERAIRLTRQRRDGEARLKLIELVYFRKSHSLTGAAIACYTSERTAKRWHSDFIKLVAEGMGFLPDERKD